MAWENSTRRARLPPDWKRRRLVVLKRDGHRCTRCGGTARLEVHHTNGDSNEIDHLVTLCHDCHDRETIRGRQSMRRERPAEKHPGLIG